MSEGGDPETPPPPVPKEPSESLDDPSEVPSADSAESADQITSSCDIYLTLRGSLQVSDSFTGKVVECWSAEIRRGKCSARMAAEGALKNVTLNGQARPEF